MNLAVEQFQKDLASFRQKLSAILAREKRSVDLKKTSSMTPEQQETLLADLNKTLSSLEKRFFTLSGLNRQTDQAR